MSMPASTTVGDLRRATGAPEEQEGQNDCLPPIDTANVPPELIAPREPPPSFTGNMASFTDRTHDTLPDYTSRRNSAASHLPPYTRATRTDSRRPTIQELLPNEEERLASLREFVEEKMYANDNFGGHKGVADGPANDPFKAFRWAKRKMSGEKGAVWRKMSVEQRARWEADGRADPDKGEMGRGDVDTHLIA